MLTLCPPSSRANGNSTSSYSSRFKSPLVTRLAAVRAIERVSPDSMARPFATSARKTTTPIVSVDARGGLASGARSGRAAGVRIPKLAASPAMPLVASDGPLMLGERVVELVGAIVAADEIERLALGGLEHGQERLAARRRDRTRWQPWM